MQHTTRWQQLRERVVLSIALIMFCVPLVLGIYQFGTALGEPAVGLVLAVFVVGQMVRDVGPIIWKE